MSSELVLNSSPAPRGLRRQRIAYPKRLESTMAKQQKLARLASPDYKLFGKRRHRVNMENVALGES
ncbi:hypothetical protein NHJ13734_002395 [Beauveria thailandica]